MLRSGRLGGMGRIAAVAAVAILWSAAPATAVERRGFAAPREGAGGLSTWAGASRGAAFAPGAGVRRARAPAASPAPPPHSSLVLLAAVACG